jgi:hypothetical protein
MCKTLVNQETVSCNPISTNKMFKRESKRTIAKDSTAVKPMGMWHTDKNAQS